ncbi:uncharacterized protein RBU57_008080 [Macrochelys suwanniensis]
MALVAAFLHRHHVHVFPYLNNWLIRGRSRQQVQAHVQMILSSWYHNKYQQVGVGANPIHRVNRGDSRCNQGTSVPPGGPSSGSRGRNHQSPSVPHYDGETMPQVTGPHGVLHLCSTARPVATSTSAGVAGIRLPTRSQQSGHGPHSSSSHVRLPAMVVRPADGGRRSTLSVPSPLPNSGDGRISVGMGRTPQGLNNTGHVATSRARSAHQHQGAQGNSSGVPSIPALPTGPLCGSPHRQHHSRVLPEQAGQSPVITTLPRSPPPLGALFSPFHLSSGVLPPWSPERPGGQAEQTLPRPRMVHTPRRDPFDLPYLGVSPTRPVCLTNQQEVPDLLLLQRTQLGLSCGRFHDPVVTPPALRVSAFSIDPQGPSQDSQGQGERHLSGPCLGMAVLVPDPEGSVNTAPHSSPNQSRPHLTRSRSSSPSGPPLVTSHSVEDSWLNRTELACLAPVRQVLLESRKPATRLTYEAKWKRFSVWCAQQQISPLLAPVPSILDYILHLKDNHLALGSLKVHLVAISAFHPGADGCSIFAHPMALLCDPPNTIFHKDKVQLRPHASFLPKVVSRFHMSQDIFLPVFFPKPHANSREQRLHSLDVRRALTFYIERTRPFRKMPQLFVAVAERMKGAPVSSQRISS